MRKMSEILQIFWKLANENKVGTLGWGAERDRGYNSLFEAKAERRSSIKSQINKDIFLTTNYVKIFH